MSAGDVTDEEIQDFKRLFPASRRLATALEASRAEAAALRRQVEERESPDWVTVREKWWTVAQILANAWRRHPLTCGERAKLVAEWDALRSGEAVATPPTDVVTVPMEELEILRDGFGLLRTAWNISGFDERLSAQADALIERHNALRSGEAGWGKS